MRTVIVIPTFNESQNILGILDRIHAADPNYQALVVDDASPDGTADLVAERANTDSRVHLLRRTQRGLGTAVRDGFIQALDLGADHIGQMDADGSHDPAMFPLMQAKINAGEADLVIGSRYIDTGKVEGWGIGRYLNSHVANWLAWLGTGLRVADRTNGLRLFRREVLETLDLPGILSPGYSVILETNLRTQQAGFRIVEIPITFHKRLAGVSKCGWREVTRFCWLLAQLHFRPMKFNRRPATAMTEPSENQRRAA